MSAEPGSATVAIAIKERGSRYSLSLSGCTSSSLDLPNLGSLQNLRDLRHTVDGDLSKFKELLGDELNLITSDMGNNREEWNCLDEAMRFLYESGQACLGSLLGREEPQSWKVKEYFVKSLQAWKMQTSAVPLIEIQAPVEVLFPIEMLPLFGVGRPTRVKDPLSLRQAVSGFLGFMAIVRRALPIPIKEPNNHVLRARGKLPVKFFHNAAELTGSQDEAKFFQERSSLVTLEGPWPRDDTDAAAVLDKAIETLYDPAIGFDGLCRDEADQIQHLACHCDMDEEDLIDSKLILASESGTVEAPISLKKLKVGFMDLREAAAIGTAQRIRDETSLPLVFLNACASSKMSPQSSTSFPNHFMTWSNRGVIGTETVIPDVVASEFSRLFYRMLLRGRTVGTALYLARNLLLRRRYNPLGIVYTFYGDPDLCLKRE